jgi:hypothetical protein
MGQHVLLCGRATVQEFDLVGAFETFQLHPKTATAFVPALHI